MTLLALCQSVLAVGDIYQTTLKNGLKVIVVEDNRSPIVINSIWFRVGSSYEHNGITGISHMLEHMMFRGTEKLGPGLFEAAVNSYGGDQNAITSNDHTVYYQVTSKKHLPKLMALESDRLRGLKLSQKLFAKEKHVVMEERRMRTNDVPAARAQEQMWAAAYVANPMHHPVIGWMSDIENYKLKDLQDWYDKWYHPNNAFLLVIGDVKHEHVFKLAKKYFGNIPAKPIAKLKPRLTTLTHGHKKVHLNIPSKNRYLLFAFRVPSSQTADNLSKLYALSLLNQILGVGTGSKLYDNLVLQNNLATAVESVYNSPFLRHQGLLYFLIIPNKDTSNKTIEKSVWQQINALKKGEFTEKSLDRAKNSLLADVVYQNDDFSDILHFYGLFEIAHQPLTKIKTLNKDIRQVTKKQVQDAAKEYFTKDRLTTVTVGKQTGDNQ